MKRTHSSLLGAGLAILAGACGGSTNDAAPSPSTAPVEAASDASHGDDHSHAEEPLGTITLGSLAVELAQGHGAVAAGKDGHLVVKLPYSDEGSTVVRAWLGGEDRTLSYVGKGTYAPSHDDYDIHATAPDPLPADPMWWIEVEQPDGTRLVGSARPILE